MRKKLGKLLNIKASYSGRVGETSEDGTNIVITNILYKGKFICDHVWVSNTNFVREDLKTKKVTFTATAISYIDTQGKRKYGLSKVHDVHEESPLHAELKHNIKYRNRRMK